MYMPRPMSLPGASALLFVFLQAQLVEAGDIDPIAVTTRDGVEIRIHAEADRPKILEGRDQLARILQQYEVGPWILQHDVVVSDKGVPHSHPRLTLTTGSAYLKDDHRQLSVFIHEQIHWYLEDQDIKRCLGRALDRLRETYRDVPVGNGLGARSEGSTYLHLVVNWLELAGATELLGEAEARRVASTYGHYRWIYAQVLADSDKIGKIIEKSGLEITPRINCEP